MCDNAEISIIIPFYNENNNTDDIDNTDNTDDTDDTDDTDECIICFNNVKKCLYFIENTPNNEAYDYEKNNRKTFFYYNLKNQNCNCNYNIHFECLVYWLLINKYCPICRTNINVNNSNSPLKIEQKYNKLIIISDNTNINNYIVIDLDHCEFIDNTLTKQENNIEQHNNIDNNIFTVREISSITVSKFVALFLFIFLFVILIIMYYKV